MMKTSIAVCALLGMMGNTNAVSLATQQDASLTIGEPATASTQQLYIQQADLTYEPLNLAQTATKYFPSAMQEQVLGNIFRDFRDKEEKTIDGTKQNTRISFQQFATLLRNFKIYPKNNDCSGEDDSDFYRRFMGDSCTGDKPNFKIPQIVRCDGIVVYCADAGYLRAFNAHNPDSTGLDDSLSYIQFKEAISNLDAELDPTGAGGIYKTMTFPQIGAMRVSAVIYELTSVFSDTGKGGEGYKKVNEEIKYGTTDSQEITHAVTVDAEANQSWATGSVTGGVTYDFSATFAKINSVEQTIKTELLLDFSVPNYVYNYKVTLFYADGGLSVIYGGEYISHREGGEALRRRLDFDLDGTVRKTTILACAVCDSDQATI